MAIVDPWPAKTKMAMERNSARAALRAAGWLASLGSPIAILLMGIVLFRTRTGDVKYLYKLQTRKQLDIEMAVSCLLFMFVMGNSKDMN